MTAACSGSEAGRRGRASGVIAACVRHQQRIAAASSHATGELDAIAIEPPPEVRGRVAFDRVCGRCHPHGGEDIGPEIRGRALPEREVRTRVREGGTIMSAIPEACLGARDLDDVVVYLRTIQAIAP